jgi:hypothetical protein
VFVGAIGYAYQQILTTSERRLFLANSDHVFGIGPQVGYIFPIGDKQGFLNLKGYKEFAAESRPEGWNLWLTFAVSNAAPTSRSAWPKFNVRFTSGGRNGVQSPAFTSRASLWEYDHAPTHFNIRSKPHRRRCHAVTL